MLCWALYLLGAAQMFAFGKWVNSPWTMPQALLRYRRVALVVIALLWPIIISAVLVARTKVRLLP